MTALTCASCREEFKEGDKILGQIEYTHGGGNNMPALSFNIIDHYVIGMKLLDFFHKDCLQ